MLIKALITLKKNNVPSKLLKNPVHFLSLGFGSGLSPYAPGTMGTLAAIPLYLLLQTQSLQIYLMITVASLVLGIYLCEKTAIALGVHDHAGIVWDEIVGLFITLLAVPFEWKWLLCGFILFRFFDIVKPWPIRWVDSKVTSRTFFIPLSTLNSIVSRLTWS